MVGARTAREAVEVVYRAEYARIFAGLVRTLRDFDRAEDALAEALAVALERWPLEGVPERPAAWITTTAQRKGIERLRRERVGEDKVADLAADVAGGPVPLSDPGADPAAGLDSSLSDDRLELVFTCCHPALALEAQVALTLRSLCGLTTAEIAKAFLVGETTMAQRLVRARRKIREAGIPFRVPPDELLALRLPAVLVVVYLVFNEGYSSAVGDTPVREELCAEAIRLGRLVTELMPDEPEVLGLLALMLLQDSRRAARATEEGDLVLLEDQDRSLWDAQAITEGLELLDRALRVRRSGEYQLQAAVAALHARSASPDETDWAQIAMLYAELLRRTGSPVVRLNHAVAVAMAQGPQHGLELIRPLEESGELGDYFLLHSAVGDLERRLGNLRKARAAYHRALGLATGRSDERFLRRRLGELGA